MAVSGKITVISCLQNIFTLSVLLCISGVCGCAMRELHNVVTTSACCPPGASSWNYKNVYKSLSPNIHKELRQNDLHKIP